MSRLLGVGLLALMSCLFGVGLLTLMIMRSAPELYRQVGAQVDNDGAAAAVIHELFGPFVEVASALENNLGICESRNVRGARFVVVRVGIRLEDLRDLNILASDRANNVGHLGGGSNGPDLVRARVAVTAATAACDYQ